MFDTNLFFEKARRISRKSTIPARDFWDLFTMAVLEFGRMLAAIPPPTSAGRTSHLFSRPTQPPAEPRSTPSPDDLIAEDLIESFGDGDGAENTKA